MDTGADYSLLGRKLSRRLRKVMTPWDGPEIRTAGGHLITPVGRCTTRVVIHGKTCSENFSVLQDCSKDVISGMCEYKVVIDLRKNRITLSKPSPMPEESKATSAVICVSVDPVNLLSRSSLFVSVETDDATRIELLLEESVQRLIEKSIGIARGVAELNDGRTMVLVTSFRTESQLLTKRTAVGYVEEFRD